MPSRRRRAIIGALAALTGAGLITATLSGPSATTTAASADTVQTATCTDGGKHLWTIRSTWGAEFTEGGVRKVTNDVTGFTTAAADATTVDYTVKTYGPTGTLLQTLGEQDRAFDFKAGTAYLNRNPQNPPTGPGKTKIVVNLGDGDDGFGNCTVTLVQPATTPAPTTPAPTTPAPDPVVVAVGDIACPPSVATTSTTCQQKAVGAKIAAERAAAFLPLGDLQYESGSTAEFAAYDGALGSLKGITRPVPGNHEYRTAGAAPYYTYFGARAGDPAKGYYSYDIGGWHFIALNSEKDITATGAQVAWLKADLAANTSPCTAAYWHRPRWSTGYEHGDAADVQPFIQALYDGRADLVLQGHDHNYERFQPLNPAGQVDTARGLTTIVSGLGGKNMKPVTGRATTAAKNASGFGYTRMALHQGSADITYVPVTGTYRDSLSLPCHDAASSTPTQTATLATATPTEPPSSPAATPTVTPTDSPTVAPSPADTPADPSVTGAGALLGWGDPTARDEFDYTGAPDPTRWAVYNSVGHAGQGLRRPTQWSVGGEYARVTGTADGTTGGMSFKPDRTGTTSGRWEARMRITRQPPYHPVLIVWPDAGRVTANSCQEVDFAESTKVVDTQRFYLHYDCANHTTTASRALDMTTWHTYAVEWTPTKITGYIDGAPFFTDTTHAPTLRAPSHLTVQLDWFPGDGTTTAESTMDLDWVRFWRL